MTIAFDIYRRTVSAGSLAIAVALAGLTGCTTGDLPTRPETEQFLVESVRLTHQITFASDTAEMAPATPDALLAFLGEADPDGKAEIYLDAKGPLKNERLDAVAAVLRDLNRIASGTGGAAATDFGVTVTVADDIVIPASCMDHDQWPNANLPPASCTTALTLVRMVEDPDDLLRGRTLGPASGARAAETAAHHMQRKALTTEVPANAEGQLPPSNQAREASY